MKNVYGPYYTLYAILPDFTPNNIYPKNSFAILIFDDYC